MERTNIRDITMAMVGGAVDIAVGDLSFISLRLVIPPLVSVCQPGAPMVLLVKPEFEAGRAEVSRGRGVITDPAIWQRVQDEIGQVLIASRCEVAGWTDSPVTGADGNREFLVHAITPGRA
jgi:23S rRNA (cytidine1920-2'-O)/16S rRNA (cytidine1409-2'-O)-methyltransferase